MMGIYEPCALSCQQKSNHRIIIFYREKIIDCYIFIFYILQSIILKELFDKKNITSKVVQGWLKMDGIYQTWHCWVETPDGRYDVAQAVIQEIRPSIKEMNIEYLIEQDSNIDVLKSNDQDGNIKQWDCYCKDPKKFWSVLKKESREITLFRNKILK